MTTSNSKLSDISVAIGTIADATIKLKKAELLKNEAAITERLNTIVTNFVEKLSMAVDVLDLTKEAVPVQPAGGHTGVGVAQSNPAVTAPVTDPNKNALGEQLFAGKSLRELNQMNSAPLFKLASDISRFPNVNPNVPLQGQMYENDWRQSLIAYIVSNAVFAQ